MVVATLAIAGTLHLVAAGAFLHVARTVSRRLVSPAEGPASRAFVAWWLCLGIYMTIEGALTFAAAVGFAPLGLFLAARAATIPLLCAGVWGLTHHILYLYTGRGGLGRPLAAFFGLVAATFYVAGFMPMPRSLDVEGWGVALSNTGEGVVFKLVYLAVGLPPILASIAYLSLIPRLEGPEPRYRAMLVGGGILLWVASGLVAHLGASDLAKFVTLAVFGLGAAAAVVSAYHPPASVRQGIARPRGASKQERETELERRCRELV
jgi:hypothetical protein